MAPPTRPNAPAQKANEARIDLTSRSWERVILPAYLVQTRKGSPRSGLLEMNFEGGCTNLSPTTCRSEPASAPFRAAA